MCCSNQYQPPSQDLSDAQRIRISARVSSLRPTKLKALAEVIVIPHNSFDNEFLSWLHVEAQLKFIACIE
jgi:hypothetical protein